jgi:hypothetical protein
MLLVANLLAFYGFQGRVSTEGFTSSFLNGAGVDAKPMGPFDGVRLSTGNSSQYRYNHPDEPMEGNYPPFKLGMDNLFMFKDNKVSSECCASDYSSDSGCVCLSKAQRAFINSRGNNRTVEDGF